jgi:alpha-tubulin suppressor-like RCC1 family protein
MLASRPQPVAVVGLPKIVAIAAVNLQSYAVGEDGSLWAWGQNSLGQLGVGNTTNSPRPRAVAIGAPVREVAAGLVHGVAVTRDGALWGWGSNDSAQLTADGPARSSTPLVLPTR